MASPTDYYSTMPVPGAPKTGGALTGVQSGIVAPPNPPAPNSAPAGAPPSPKPPTSLPPTYKDQYGTTQPNPAGGGGGYTGSLPPVVSPGVAGAPGGGGKGGGKADLGAYGAGIEGKINSYLENLMSGNGTPFNPEVMGKLRGRLFGAASGQADTAIGQANDDAVKRGMFRSGLPTEAILQARAQAGQNYTKGEADLESQATQANSAAQQKAVEDLMAQLENSRGYKLNVKKLQQSAPKGPDYNQQLMSLIGGMDAPNFG